MGKHSMMSVLPKKWIDKHQLKKGDYVEFTESQNKLILTSTAEIFERKVEINIDSPAKHIIWRLIQPTYILGYDEVKINFSNPKSIKTIEWTIRLLIGFEIVEIKDNYMILKSVSKQLDRDINPIMKRVWRILIQSSKICVDAFENKDKEKLEEIYPLEMTINKYVMLLKRIINRTGYKYHHYTYMIISFLELISNHFEYIRKYFIETSSKNKIRKETTEYAKKISQLIQDVFELQYNFKRSKFNKIEKELPHFLWFEDMKDKDMKVHFKIMAEYLMQISRSIEAININSKKE